MKAKLIDQRKFEVLSRSGKPVAIFMDLYKILGEEARKHPEGYRFSWIAFDVGHPKRRVIFDSHPPKGPHYHIDGDVIGVGIAWESLDKAMNLFFKTVSRHFNIDPEDFK